MNSNNKQIVNSRKHQLVHHLRRYLPSYILLFGIAVLMMVALGKPITSALLHPPSRFLLNVEEFPAGWSAGETVSDHDTTELFYVASDAAGRYYMYRSTDIGRDAPANHLVAWSFTEGQAEQTYLRLVEYYFHDNASVIGSWYEPDGWRYMSSNADESQFGCARWRGTRGEAEQCLLVARYGHYTSIFRVYTDSSSLTKDELQHLVEAIDRNFKQPYH